MPAWGTAKPYEENTKIMKNDDDGNVGRDQPLITRYNDNDVIFGWELIMPIATN